jgi:antitoxin PrlF
VLGFIVYLRLGRFGFCGGGVVVASGKNLFTCMNFWNSMTEQIEDVIKVSSKGQIVIPREVRRKLGVKGGEKLLVLTCDGDIVLRKAKEMSIDDIAKKVGKTIREENIDVEELVAEAVEWARKSK